MALGYLMLFFLLAALAGTAGFLLKTAWSFWRLSRRRAAAVLFLLLALLSAAAACYLLGIVWQEPPWRFHF